jgi:hypothetical protein
MRFEALLGALVILFDLSGAARAELAGKTAEPPRFTAADHHTIDRNEMLRAIVANDPWLVRRILDLVARWSGAEPHGSNAAPSDGLDPQSDPDLAGADRTAEGSIEWLELLKRARAEKEARDKDAVAASGRTAEGSVELFEMMRKAKAAKEAVGK